VRALLEQLEAVLPHLPDRDRRRPVAELLARACLLAGTHALDENDPESAVTRFARAADMATAAGAADLAVDAAVGHADALLEVGASRAALAVLEHAGVDVAHPPPGLHVELTAAQHSSGQPVREKHRRADDVERLTTALAREPPSARDRAVLHADLARALRCAGRDDEAAAHARKARALATRIGARRVLRTLGGQGLSAGTAVPSSASAAP
jgi:hypothetical protein